MYPTLVPARIANIASQLDICQRHRGYVAVISVYKFLPLLGVINIVPSTLLW
jgi:hypothetical protein